MVAPHSWRECRPVLLDFGCSEPEQLVQTKLEMAWSLVPDDDRRLFHQRCCFGLCTPESDAAVERISGLIRAALDQ
jgi:hypothetical protein